MTAICLQDEQGVLCMAAAMCAGTGFGTRTELGACITLITNFGCRVESFTLGLAAHAMHERGLHIG